MPHMNLEFKDRLILSNQYRILAVLYPNEADSFRGAQKVVENGYELNYDWISEHISPQPMSDEHCREVLDILEMFRHLGYAYDALEDKTEIDEHHIRFLGFDGNNEGAYLSYADYIINDTGRYQESKNAGDNLNSHMPTIAMYRRMLRAWEPLRDKHPLEKEDIQQIVAARVHP